MLIDHNNKAPVKILRQDEAYLMPFRQQESKSKR